MINFRLEGRFLGGEEDGKTLTRSSNLLVGRMGAGKAGGGLLLLNSKKNNQPCASNDPLDAYR